MGMSIPAIETHYGGCHFRSRTEAKWAVFFDTLGVQWEYEKEGFELGELGRYLPDFWLPDLDCWIEIKGQKATKKEEQKCEALCMGTEKTVYLFVGVPKGSEQEHLNADNFVFRFEIQNYGSLAYDNYQGWVACTKCKKVGIGYSSWSRRLCVCRDPREDDSSPREKGKSELSDFRRIDNACTKATQARFEFRDAQPVRPDPVCFHPLDVFGILLASNGSLQICTFCALCRVKLSDAHPQEKFILSDMDVFKSNLLSHEDDIPYAKEYVAKKIADRKQQAEEKP